MSAVLADALTTDGALILAALRATAVIRKRDGTLAAFDERRILRALGGAFREVYGVPAELELPPTVVADRDRVARLMFGELVKRAKPLQPIDMEEVQDIAEAALMSSGFHDVARAYILYREAHATLRKRDLFKKRIHLKPYEYPELLAYVDAIRHSYWIHTEFNYTSDIQDFHVGISDVERSAIRNTLLAISQIEVAVKTFWGAMHEKIPKPEIGAVGATFAESEVRHHDAYSHLLEILGLNEEFARLRERSVIMERVNYLETALRHAKSDDPSAYAQSLLLFSLFIEHVSLFSQFLIIMAFNKHRDRLKGISNVVEATSKEEQIHGNFGIELITIMKAEHPGWFGPAHAHVVRALCLKAFEAERNIVDWIFEAGELDFLPKAVVHEFIKHRLNRALTAIDIKPVFTVDPALLKASEWFDDEIIGTKHGDFFNKRSVNYNKRSKSITSNDLF
jgi:ribonucleoside-diphosphate reductase beta chain